MEIKPETMLYIILILCIFTILFISVKLILSRIKTKLKAIPIVVWCGY